MSPNTKRHNACRVLLDQSLGKTDRILKLLVGANHVIRRHDQHCGITINMLYHRGSQAYAWGRISFARFTDNPGAGKLSFDLGTNTYIGDH